MKQTDTHMYYIHTLNCYCNFNSKVRWMANTENRIPYNESVFVPIGKLYIPIFSEKITLYCCMKRSLSKVNVGFIQLNIACRVEFANHPEIE